MMERPPLDDLAPLVRGYVWQGLALGGILTIALTTAVFLYGFYNAFLHPLRKYPGPLLWTAYRFPYVIAIHRSQIHQRLKEYHDRYGTIVRIAPNELSYADGAAWKDIYGNRPGHQPFERNNIWFRKLTPDEPYSIMGTNEEAHARMKRAFSNSFSEKSLKDQAPIIESYVDMLMHQLKAPTAGRTWTEKIVDLTQWFNFLTFDISGDLSFGESFDCLKTGKAHYWVEITQSFGRGLSLVASINHYPPFHKLLRYVIPQHIYQRQLDHRRMSAEKARKRLDMDVERPDWVSPTKSYNDQKAVLSDSEWELNMSILVFAGSETTSTALTAIARRLVQNRGALYRVTQEIRSTFADESEIKLATTSNLPYLNAVINEGMRIDPPTVIGIPRVVPPGGDTICGKWVPGGTLVAYNQYPANRQPSNFHHPNSFLPERFLSPSPTDALFSLQPFGIGRHGCIGIKLAWAELRLTLARLLWAFDLRLADEMGDRWDWAVQDTHIFWDKKPLNVKLEWRGK